MNSTILRQISIVFLFLDMFVLPSLAQNVNSLDSSLNLKKGFYLNFEQIIEKTPYRVDEFNIRIRGESEIFLIGGGLTSFDLKSENKSEFKKIRKEIVGFSDGIDFYISDKYTIGGWIGFTKCYLAGPYIVAPIQGSVGQYTGGGIIPSLINVGNGFLIDIPNKKSTKITKRLIKQLLAEYPDLSSEYQNKENILDYTLEILKKINYKKLNVTK